MKGTTRKFYTHKIANLINVQKIVTVHYQDLDNNYVFPGEAHDFWEINYADKGDVEIGLGDKEILLQNGDIVFIQPNQPHYVKNTSHEPKLFIISFICRSPSMQFFKDKYFTLPKQYRYLLENITTEALGTYNLPDFDPNLRELKLKQNPNLGGEQLIKNTLENLLIYLLRHAQQIQPTQEYFISKISTSSELHEEILRILHSKLYDKFRLEDLCEQLHYGTTQLCTFFKQQTGMSIYQTYLKLKISEAKKLIRKEYSFAKIVDLLCFDSVSSFTYIFKKRTGMTPNEYRNSIKKTNS